jgi:alkyl hydroperoxide reductase subunit AhpC
MTAYQAGIAKFTESGAQVIGITTDNSPSQSYWAKEVLKLSFPLGSDFMRSVSKTYGVLIEQSGIANRATFVVDQNGIIQHIEEGKTALDPDGAATACSRLTKH